MKRTILALTAAGAMGAAMGATNIQFKTGGDGSRSKYFDGARFAWHVDEGRTLDFFAVYCAAEDYLPTLGRERQNGKKPAHYDQNGYLQD